MNTSDTVDQMEVNVEFLTRRMDAMVDAQMEMDQWVVWLEWELANSQRNVGMLVLEWE